MFTLVHPSHVERTRVATAAAMLREVADRVAMVTDEDLVALARGAEALGRHVDALRTRIAGEVDVRSGQELVGPTDDDRLSSRYGCGNAVELLERTTRASVKTLRQRVRLDRHTRTHTTLTGHIQPARFPEVSDAFRAGKLSMDAACYLTDEFTRLRHRGHTSPEETTIAEQEIIRAVTTGIDGAPADDAAEVPADGVLPETFDEFRVIVDTWSTFLARDGIEPDAEYAERFRGLNLGRTRDGLVPVAGNLVPEAAAGLQLLFDAHNGSTTRFRTSPEDAPASAAWTDDEQVHDPRTAPQKRHDVLVSIIQAAAAATDTPSLGGAAPTLQISTAVGDLDGGTAIIDRTQAPVPSSLAHRIACTGAVQKVVFDRNGRIVRLGAPDRLFNAHQRRAIGIRDGGCIIPGCSIPAAWCEVHHVTEYAQSGPTHTDNGVLLCWAHHHRLERSGWQIQMRGGTPYVKAPGWIDPRGIFRAVRNQRTERERVRQRSRHETPPLQLPIPTG
ncbi:hypothetical protein GCM10010915_24070 [Microbacterium faecale]|uniref:HNH nuclease domain-containing protein n=1 Tax=Microbacterium faecale TaxID=1804630 RepID=A0A916YEF3_9MICO|nr:HNH endonuclease signature motif containing protein [Microbacterium faecale]GGD42194.1 hypothetical protein GCM10010915_24070 [Microbacterium faecale]